MRAPWSASPRRTPKTPGLPGISAAPEGDDADGERAVGKGGGGDPLADGDFGGVDPLDGFKGTEVFVGDFEHGEVLALDNADEGGMALAGADGEAYADGDFTGEFGGLGEDVAVGGDDGAEGGGLAVGEDAGGGVAGAGGDGDEGGGDGGGGLGVVAVDELGAGGGGEEEEAQGH